MIGSATMTLSHLTLHRRQRDETEETTPQSKQSNQRLTFVCLSFHRRKRLFYDFCHFALLAAGWSDFKAIKIPRRLWYTEHLASQKTSRIPFLFLNSCQIMASRCWQTVKATAQSDRFNSIASFSKIGSATACLDDRIDGTLCC